MSIFKKKSEPVVLPFPPKVGGKKVSVFDVHKQAYYEVSLDEYYSMLRGLGLSEEEARAKINKLGA